MSEQVIDAEVVEQPGTEVAHVAAAPPSLFGTERGGVLAAATETANELAPVLRKQGMTVNISGKDHVRVEGWTTLGSMLGVTPVGVWTRKIENGWEAKVNAQTLDGRVIGSAEAMCVRDEKRWADADEYAIRSMAQTRASSKALASVLRFVVTLAGFSGTPAEEMDGVNASAGGRGKPSAKQLDLIRSLATEAGFDGTELEAIADWAASELTGGKQGTCSKLIDGLMSKDAAKKTETRDKLGATAKKWAASRPAADADLPEPDMAGLEVVDDPAADEVPF